jgi:hypothetical protein
MGRVGRVLARFRAVWLWACLAWLLVLVAWRSELRESLWVAVQGYWLLIAWFWLARTKSVSWRLVAGLYSVCMPWSMVVAFITHALARHATAHGFAGVVLAGDVNDLGSASVIAGVGEECAKLLPLVVLALLAPGRVRRFAVVDWLLVGFSCGLAFQVAEDLARRVAAHVMRPGLLDMFLGTVTDRGPDSGYPQYGLSPLGGWSQWVVGTQFPGHHATTALVTVCAGLGLTAWRRGAHRRFAVLWRAGGIAASVVMLWLVVSVHAGGNATAAVQDRWLTAEHPSMPWLIRSGWQVAHHGVGLRWLLVVLLVVALAVDARQLRRGDAVGHDGPVLGVPFSPSLRADAWMGSLLGTGTATVTNGSSAGTGSRTRAGVWRGMVEAVVTFAAYAWRDVLFLLQAHVVQAGESRRAALVRARTAMGLTRRAREEGLARSLGAAGAAGRARTRVMALLVLLGLLAALFWLAPHCAEQVGNSPDARALGHAVLPDGEWFAGLLEALGRWWDGLSPGGKIAVGAGVAALVALSGGSFGLALGASGAATYLLGHSRGAAAFVTDPVAATRSYLAHTSPLGVAADVTEGVLTFLPGNFAGAATGTFVRNGVRVYLRDPEAWWAAQRAPRYDDRGAIDLGAFLRREPIELADGTSWAALPAHQQAAMRQWWESLPTSRLNATGPEGAYQVHLYGDTEHIVGHDPKVIADGATIDYGAIADAKFRTHARSWYDPSSLSPKVSQFAQETMDFRLQKYARVLNDTSNPAKVLEISTNDPAVAAFIESRLRALGIPGYVRLEAF